MTSCASTANRSAGRRTALLAWLAAGAALWLLMCWRSMALPLSHDEHMYVAAGKLIAEQQVPYRDYPYFQMPYLPYLYAGLFALTPYLLAAGRLFSVLCALGIVLLLALECRRLWAPAAPALRTWVVAAGLGLLVFNPLFNYAGFWAWNHTPAVLLLLAAYGVHCRARGRPGFHFLCGALVGLSVGLRLTMIVAVAPFALALTVEGRPGRSRAQRAGLIMMFGAGLLAGLLPALAVMARSPSNFWFDNVRYHALNAQWAADPLRGQLSRKAVFLLRQVLLLPGNLLLALSAAVLAWRFSVRPGTAEFRRPRAGCAGWLAMVLFLGALVPDPPQLQYFFALVPFAIIAVLEQLAAQPPERQARGARVLAVAAVLTIAAGLPAYRCLWTACAPEQWVPVRVHRAGERLAASAAGARVITIAPIYPLEGGARIPAVCAAGSFGWRMGALLEAGARRRLRLATPRDVDELAAANRPAVLLTGSERPREEEPLLDFARRQGWGRRDITDGLTLHGAIF